MGYTLKLSSAEGAALVMDGPVTITNSRIANNTGRNTGGIYVGDTFSLVATGTLFESNIATANNARGGAIYKSSNSNLTLTGCVFKSNSAASTGSRGGAIHRQSGGTVIINDCSFLGNIAPVNNGAAIYNSSGNINAEYNWWGAVNGPSGLGSGSGNAINGVAFDFTPFRTTLPPFTPNSFMPTNPSLPQPIPGCTISVNQAVNVRRGPSIDDLNIGSEASPIQITPGQTYPLRAVATDDNGNNMMYPRNRTVK